MFDGLFIMFVVTDLPNPPPKTLITPTIPTTIDRPNCDPLKQETPTPNPGPSPRPPQQGPSIVTPSTYKAARLSSSGNQHPPAQAITDSPSMDYFPG